MVSFQWTGVVASSQGLGQPSSGSHLPLGWGQLLAIPVDMLDLVPNQQGHHQPQSSAVVVEELQQGPLGGDNQDEDLGGTQVTDF